MLQLEIKLFGDDGQLSHVFLPAAGMRTDEIRYDLLVQSLLAIDAVEDALKVLEQLERGLTHEHEHAVAGVFGCYLQATADVAADELACVVIGCTVAGFVLAAMEQQVVANATADEAFLNLRKGIDRVIDLQQLGVVGVEIGTHLRMDATGTATFLTGFQVVSVHAVHVG